MNKTKMILAGTGGAAGLVVLVLGFLVWQAFSAKTAAIEGDEEEGTDGLETVESRAQGLSRKPIYPSAASVAAIEQNQKSVDDWSADGRLLAVRGDKTFPRTTPAQFKTDLVRDAKRLMELPGGVAGKLVKPDFAFGPFKDYIVEGKMPSETELAELQRKWDDVATITEMLSTNGVVELLDVGFVAAKKDEGQETKDARRGKAGQRTKDKGQRPESTAIRPLSYSYVFSFSARPAAFVRMLNDLEQCERFVTVDGFSFVRPGDVIAATLGGDEKKTAAEASGGRRSRRGRRGGGAQPDAAAPRGEDAAGTVKEKNGVVTDPLQDAPMTVTMTVSVHDFRSLEEESAAAPRSEDAAGTVKKGASK